mmetsp:Transcript_17227/g.33564  ORF Transcript_17227/g.33564 Transcript_17227/m.33564 type:complete len:193 (+) Transcript_17227:91-669(+)
MKFLFLTFFAAASVSAFGGSALGGSAAAGFRVRGGDDSDDSESIRSSTSKSTSESTSESTSCPAQSVYTLDAPDVTITTYRDERCTDVASTFDFRRVPDSTQLTSMFDSSSACNELPDSWSDRLVCSSTGITWYNYPNKNDDPCPGACDPANPSGNKFNELTWDSVYQVGACTEIPGPVPTWKKINSCPCCK